jgi:hypothetical protein
MQLWVLQSILLRRQLGLRLLVHAQGQLVLPQLELWLLVLMHMMLGLQLGLFVLI